MKDGNEEQEPKKQTIAVGIEFSQGVNKKNQLVNYPEKSCFSLIRSKNGK